MIIGLAQCAASRASVHVNPVIPRHYPSVTTAPPRGYGHPLRAAARYRRMSPQRRRGRPPEGGRPLRDVRWCYPTTVRRGPLLDRDGGAGALEGGLGLVGGVLGDLLQDRLRRVVDQVLGLLEAERGQAAHLLDDLDLLVAGSLEDDVELVLLGGGLLATATAATGGGSGRDGDRGSRGDLEGLLELLHEVGQLEQRHLLERVEQIGGGQLRHGSLLLGSVGAGR